MTTAKAPTTEQPTQKPRRIFPTALKLLAVLCILALVPFVNYSVDPSALFVTSRAAAPEIAAAALMLEGEDVTGLAPNYNERLLRRECVLSMTEAPEALVVGSSRGEFITTEMLGLKTGELFNASVSGGELEDMLGFVGLLLERNLAPKTVVISLDPWLVNDAYSQARYRGSVSDGYYYFLTLLGESAPESLLNLEPLYNPDAPDGGFGSLSDEARRTLFSVSYFQSSLKYFFSGDYDYYKEVRASGMPDGVTGVVRADGSYSYALDYRNCDAATAAERARRSLPNVIGLEDYTSLKGEKYALLAEAVAYLEREGIEVKLVMFPLGNTIYEHMALSDNREHYANFFLTEALFRSLAEEAGADITGGFDPDELGFTMADFYDGYHLKEARVAEMVEGLLAQQFVN